MTAPSATLPSTPSKNTAATTAPITAPPSRRTATTAPCCRFGFITTTTATGIQPASGTFSPHATATAKPATTAPITAYMTIGRDSRTGVASAGNSSAPVCCRAPRRDHQEVAGKKARIIREPVRRDELLAGEEAGIDSNCPVWSRLACCQTASAEAPRDAITCPEAPTAWGRRARRSCRAA